MALFVMQTQHREGNTLNCLRHRLWTWGLAMFDENEGKSERRMAMFDENEGKSERRMAELRINSAGRIKEAETYISLWNTP